MALWPPERRPIPSKVIKEMENRAAKRRKTTTTTGRREGAAAELDDDNQQQDADDEDEDERHWDYDTLVDKWKKIVREDALRKRGLTIPPAVPIPHAPPVAAPIAIPTGIRHPPPATNTITSASGSTTAVHAPSATTTENTPHHHDHHDQHNPPPFEAWNKKPKFFNGEDCMVGIPVSSSSSSKQHPQQQQQPQRASNLREPVTDPPAQAQDVDADVIRDADHHQHQQHHQHIGHDPDHDHACENGDSGLPVPGRGNIGTDGGSV
jgi:hypothetical protein